MQVKHKSGPLGNADFRRSHFTSNCSTILEILGTLGKDETENETNETALFLDRGHQFLHHRFWWLPTRRGQIGFTLREGADQAAGFWLVTGDRFSHRAILW